MPSIERRKSGLLWMLIWLKHSGQLQPVLVSEPGARHLQIRGLAGVVTAILRICKLISMIFDETSTVPGESGQLLTTQFRSSLFKPDRSGFPVFAAADSLNTQLDHKDGPRLLEQDLFTQARSTES